MGFTLGASATINATDNVLQAFGKVQSQIDNINTNTGSNFLKLDGTSTMTGNMDLGSGNILNGGSATFSGTVTAADATLSGNATVTGNVVASGNVSGVNSTFTGTSTTLNQIVNGNFQLKDGDGSDNFVTVKSATNVVSNFTLTLPASPGSNGQILQTDGSGVLTWTTPAAGIGTVTSITAGTGLTATATNPITSSGTLAVDVGTAANKILQLDGTAKIPAVDGSQITGITLSQIADADTMASQSNSAVNIDGGTIDGVTIATSTGSFTTLTAASGTIDGTTIGATTPSTGSFTTLAGQSLAVDDVSIDGKTITPATANSDLLITRNGSGNIGLGEAVTPGTLVTIREEDTATNAVTNLLELSYETTGAPAAGMGIGIKMTAENSVGALENIASIEASYTDLTNTVEDSKIVFKTLNNGVPFTALTINSDGSIVAGGSLSTSVVRDANNDTLIQVEESNDENIIRFDTAGSQRMMIDGLGNVGIGTLIPAARLHSVANGENLRLEGTDHTFIGMFPDAGSRKSLIGFENASDPFLTIKTENTGATADILLDPDTGAGVGINTSTPNSALEVVEDDASNSSVTNVLTITHTTSGVPANNIGTGLVFRSENDSSSTITTSAIESVVSDVTTGSEVTDLNFKTRDSALGLDTALSIKGTGNVHITRQKELRFEDTTGGEYFGLRAPTGITTSFTMTLPDSSGTNGQSLITDGVGVLSWGSPSPGGTASGDLTGTYPAPSIASDTVDLNKLYNVTQGSVIVGTASDPVEIDMGATDASILMVTLLLIL